MAAGVPRLIALDWGTSSLRAFLFGDAGVVLDSRAAPLGIMQVADGAFAAAFAEIAGEWLRAAPGLPALACGMIGSAQGWRQAPYCKGQTGLPELAAALVAVPSGMGVDLHIVPGIAMEVPRFDVMRGEETQIFGALSLHPGMTDAARLILPGTHSKWVAVQDGGIAAFQTYMTGELFAVLRNHSILGRPARDAGTAPPADHAAFAQGVAAARASPAGLAPLLFSARTLVLADTLPASASLDYLSGLLIGDEIRCALDAGSGPLALIGDPALCQTYLHGLAAFGITDARIIAGATEAGLWQIGCRAGLVDAAV